MKILYHHRIASKDGQYVHVEEIVNAMRELGHEVIVIGPRVAEKAKFGAGGGWMSTLRRYLPGFLAELLEFSYSFYAFMLLVIAMVKHRPDAIYERYNLFMPAGIWAKKCFAVPLVLEINSPLFAERSQYGGLSLNGLARWSEHYVWKNASHCCPVTQVLAGYLYEAGVSPDKVTVIANGINPKQFYPRTVERSDDKAAPLFAGKLVLGFVGFCREWHRLDELLEQIAHYPDKNWQLLIVGDGPARAMLEQKAFALNCKDNLYITGLVAREEMPSWLERIDIALQPAVTPWSSPLKLLEYLAKGKVIIAPNAPNIAELLTDGDNALLYDSDKPLSLLTCLERLSEDKALRDKLAANAINTITERQLTWIQNAKRITALMTHLQSTQIAIKEIH